MTGKVLFLVNGHGLGNATRCHAIIEQLGQVQITIACSGKAYEYFRRCLPKAQIFNCQQLSSFCEKPASNMSMAAANVRKVLSNSMLIYSLMKKIRPDLVLTDSFYTLVPLSLCFSAPVWSINNAVVVVKNAPQIFFTKKYSLISHFLRIEFWDFLYHHFFSQKVFVPLPKAELSHPHYEQSPLIVRQEFMAPSRGERNILLFLSSSVSPIGPIKLKCPLVGLKVVVVGEGLHPTFELNQGKVEYYHQGMDLKQLRQTLANCRLVVANGGLSTLSELWVQEIPALILPLPNHSEQWINAHIFGRPTTVEKFSSDLNEMLELPQHTPAKMINDGANFIAKKITQRLEGHQQKVQAECHPGSLQS